MALALAPVLYASRYLVGQYLSPEVARQMANNAGQEQQPPRVPVAY